MGKLERLKRAFEFVTGEPPSFGGEQAEMFIEESLRMRRDSVGPIGVAGSGLVDIFERVTGEMPPAKWVKLGPVKERRKIRAEL